MILHSGDGIIFDNLVSFHRKIGHMEKICVPARPQNETSFNTKATELSRPELDEIHKSAKDAAKRIKQAFAQ